MKLIIQKGIAALAATAAVLLAAAPALADPVTWTVDTTHDGKILKGSFVTDMGARTVTSVNVTYDTATLTVGQVMVGWSDRVQLWTAPGGDATGQPGIRITLDSTDFDNALGADVVKNIPIRMTRSILCNSANCSASTDQIDDNNAGRVVTGRGPVTVPTLTEWAMILFGLALAGAAGLVLQRRQHRT